MPKTLAPKCTDPRVGKVVTRVSTTSFLEQISDAFCDQIQMHLEQCTSCRNRILHFFADSGLNLDLFKDCIQTSGNNVDSPAIQQMIGWLQDRDSKA